MTGGYVAWCSISEAEGDAIGDHPFKHTRELTSTAFGDLSQIEGGERYVAFATERDRIENSMQDAEILRGKVQYARNAQECPAEALKTVIDEMRKADEEKRMSHYEGLLKSQLEASMEAKRAELAAEEARLKAALAQEEENRLNASRLAEGSGADAAKLAQQVASLERQNKELESAKEKLQDEKQKAVNGRYSAEKSLEQLRAEMEEMKAKHEAEVAALRKGAASGSGAAEAAQAEREKFEKAAKIAKENEDKLRLALSEAEATLTEQSATMKKRIADLELELERRAKGDTSAASQREEQLAKKLGIVEKKLQDSLKETNKLQLELGELQLKLGQMKDELVRRLGAAANIDEVLECCGLKEFAEGVKKRRVFDRLYDDAMRRIKRIEELTDKIRQKERQAIARVMESRISDAKGTVQQLGEEPAGYDDDAYQSASSGARARSVEPRKHMHGTLRVTIEKDRPQSLARASMSESPKRQPTMSPTTLGAGLSVNCSAPSLPAVQSPKRRKSEPKLAADSPTSMKSPSMIDRHLRSSNAPRSSPGAPTMAKTFTEDFSPCDHPETPLSKGKMVHMKRDMLEPLGHQSSPTNHAKKAIEVRDDARSVTWAGQFGQKK